MNNKIDTILTMLITKNKTQTEIAEQIGVSQGYVSQINTKLKRLKVNPRIKDNEVVCSRCSGNGLTFYNDISTGQPIAVICNTCKKEIERENESIGNLYSDKNDKVNIELNRDLIDAIKEQWKKEHPYEPFDIQNIITHICAYYIKEEK